MALRIAAQSLSVPQLVKTISSGSAPSSAATWSRARARSCATSPPKACMLEGLP